MSEYRAPSGPTGRHFLSGISCPAWPSTAGARWDDQSHDTVNACLQSSAP